MLRALLPISRRAFVRTSVLGVAAAGLPGCGRASERVENLILGSGFGGSIAALRLAQRGQRSVILERGRRWTLSRPGEDVFTSMGLGEADHRASWLAEQQPLPGIPRHRPFTPYVGLLEKVLGNGINAVCAAGVGGGSLVYSGMMVQPPRDLFEEVFPSGISYDQMVSDFYPRVRAMLSPTTLPDDLLARPEWTATRTFLEQGLAAGYRAERLLCAFDFEAIRLELDGTVPRQALNGSYLFGLNCGAKHTLDKSYLGMAEASGLCEVRPLHWAQTIREHADGYSVVVHRIDETGVVLEEREIIARRLFVACGAVNTTGLLLRSKAEGGLPDLPDAIGSGFGNNGLFITARTCGVDTGMRQAGPACAMVYAPDERVSLENGPAPLGGEILISNGMGIPDGRGRIRWDAAMGRTTIDWDRAHNASPVASTNRVIARLNEVNGGAPLTLPGFDESITFHPLGGCVHGQGTDLVGRVDGHPGLYVVDSALLPGCTPMSNPFWTVSANAERCVEAILREDLGGGI